MENVTLEKRLKAIAEEIQTSTNLAVEMVETAIEAFFQHNKGLAQKIINELEPVMNERDLKTERHCIETIAMHHPQARELRFVTMAMKMNTELERIGDLAVGIAGTTIMLMTPKFEYDENEFKKISKKTINLLNMVKEALQENDVEKAQEVIRLDKEINEQRNIIIENFLKTIKNSSAKVEMYYDLMRIAHKLERIGDQCKNIAEELIYTVKGSMLH